MAKGDVITRKEIIEDEALNWGPEYAKQLQVAIKANEDFKKGIFDIVNAQKGIKGSTNNSQYLEEKEKARLAFQKNIQAIREQEAAEKSALKIRQETARTIKAEIDAQNKIASSKKRNTQLTIEERVAQQAENAELRKAALAKLNLTEAYTKLNKQRTEAKNKLRELIITEGESSKATEKARQEFDKLDAKVKKADKAVGDFTKNVGNYPTIGKFTAGVKDLAGAFGIVAGTAAFANVMKGAIQTVKEFDQSIADLRAITGASGKDLEYFKKQAIDLGKDTKGGAKAVVEAYKLIASAKPELLENAEALNSVTKAAITLSKASGLELPDAATRLTDAMNQFGAPAEEAAFFIDALANGAKYGSAEIPQVTDALLKFGAVAKSSNISIGESTALIELLAEKGLKGAEAGTALRNVLLKISAPDALPKEAQQAMERLEISMETLKDKSIPVQERLEALKPILEDDAAAVKVFGAENVVAAKNILANTERLAELTSKMDEFGTASEQAEIRMDTLEGKTEKLTSTYDSFILSLNEGSGVLSNSMKVLVEGLTNGLNLLIRLNTSWDELYGKANTKGKELGSNAYSTSGKDLEQLTQERKKLFEEAARIREIINKLKKDREEMGTFGTIFGSGGIEEQIEKLSGELGQIEGAWEKSRNRINEINTEATDKLKEEEEKQTEQTKEELEKRKKAREEYLKRLQKSDSDANALSLFRLEQEKEISKELSENDKESIDNRIDAYLYANQLEVAIAQETATQKLKDISRYSDEVRDLTDEEIQTLINGGKIKKKLTDEEILVLEQYAAKQKDIDDNILKGKQKIIDEDVKRSLDSFKTKIEGLKDYEANLIRNKENEILILQTNFKKGLISQKEYEKELKKINEDSNEEILKQKIEYLENELSSFADTNEKKIILEKELHKLRVNLSNVETEKLLENEQKIKDFRSEKISEASNVIAEAFNIDSANLNTFLEGVIEGFDNFEDAFEASAAVVKDIGNAVFDARIQRIDEDIQKNDEYYAKQIELAGNDQRQKELLEKEAEKKRQELEKKKRKEQEKQAIFNKALKVVDIGVATALGIMQSYAQLGPIAGSAGAALVGALGAIQLAAVLATPIPKYKHGRKGGPAEIAMVGDGFVNEVIENPDGSAYITPNYPTLTYLEKDAKVHSSVDDYLALQRASTMASLQSQGKQMNDYEAMQLFNNAYSKELLEEAKLTRKAIEKQKGPVIINKNNDLEYESWKILFGKFKS